MGVRVYFVAEFLQSPSSFGVWAGGKVWPGKKAATGNDCGAYVGERDSTIQWSISKLFSS